MYWDLFYGPGYDLSWWTFLAYLKRMCSLKLMSALFYKCQLGYSVDNIFQIFYSLTDFSGCFFLSINIEVFKIFWLCLCICLFLLLVLSVFASCILKFLLCPCIFRIIRFSWWKDLLIPDSVSYSVSLPCLFINIAVSAFFWLFCNMVYHVKNCEAPEILSSWKVTS